MKYEVKLDNRWRRVNGVFERSDGYLWYEDVFGRLEVAKPGRWRKVAGKRKGMEAPQCQK